MHIILKRIKWCMSMLFHNLQVFELQCFVWCQLQVLIVSILQVFALYALLYVCWLFTAQVGADTTASLSVMCGLHIAVDNVNIWDINHTSSMIHIKPLLKLNIISFNASITRNCILFSLWQHNYVHPQCHNWYAINNYAVNHIMYMCVLATTKKR